MSIKISVDLNQYESITRAIEQWIKILKSDYYLNNPKNIIIEDITQGILKPDVLKRSYLYNKSAETIPSLGSDLVFILKIIEIEMEEEASDIAFAMSTFLKQVDYNLLNTQDGYILGLDIIYAVSTAYPYWSYCLGRAINPNWPKESQELIIPILKQYIITEKWTDDTLGVFIYCDQEEIRKALSQLDLKFFLNLPKKLKLFKNLIVKKHKKDLSSNQIESYFENAQKDYSVEDIQDVLKQLSVKKINQVQAQSKAYVLEKSSSRELIHLKYMLVLPQETEVTIKIEHPINEMGEEMTKHKVTCIDGQINNIRLCPHCPGNYTITILIKGKPLIKERFLIEDRALTKIKDVKIGNYYAYDFVPFENMDKPFGIEFTIESGKVNGLIYHPRFIKELFNDVVETDVEQCTYVNPGTYHMTINPRDFINYEKGFFEFLLWNEKETELLYRTVFFENKNPVPLNSKEEELEFIETLALETFYKEDPKRFNQNVLRGTIGEFEALFHKNYFKFCTKEEIIQYLVTLADGCFNSLNGYLPNHVDLIWQNEIKSKEEPSKTEVLNYGVYEKADNFIEGINTSLKPQKKYLKIKLGSYFGISYNLNPFWFKEDITISCNVSLVKDGRKIIDETWNDISFHNKKNQFIYRVETKEELHGGWWQFNLYYQNECILNQYIKVEN
ncbi:hypothetical protein [Oceanirhabdus seepicola]|uniref:Uncharacterized protein n=1 Tax=Oceanirhabdus seepicola TaxID=2828781 RepID=A0A9J6NXB7_9CLOT|nr:hypothetical protein [Oceanirhabdus seepicola]MCM1988269.1 hypothetical protein [Oceanirhabdus seepicola]